VDISIAKTIWSLIETESPGRAIILTTHTMAEADSLSSRIAIMGEGRVRCVGSPLFLKRQYGVGYTLAVARVPRADSKRLEETVARLVDGSKLMVSSDAETSFSLPFESTAQFPALLRELDTDEETGGTRLGVESFTLSATTLEHVFLAVAEKGSGAGSDDENADDGSGERVHPDDYYSTEAETTYTDYSYGGSSASSSSGSFADDGGGGRGSSAGGRRSATPPSDLPSMSLHTDAIKSHLQPGKGKQFSALMRKRFLVARRSKSGFFLQLVLPIIFLITAVISYKTVDVVEVSSGEALNLSDPLTMYGGNMSLPISASSNETLAVQAFVPAVQRAVAPSVFDARVVGTLDALRNQVLIAADKTGGNVHFAIAMDGPALGPGSDAPEVPAGGAVAATDPVRAAQYVAPLCLTSVRAVHAAPSLLAVAGSAQLQMALRRSDVAFAVESKALPKAADDIAPDRADVGRIALLILYLPIVAFAFIPAFGAAVVAKEREDGVKHQQILAGVDPVIYWLSNFAVDLCVFLVTYIISVIILIAAPVEEVSPGSDRFAFALLLLLYGLCAIPMCYVLTLFLARAKRAMSMSLLLLIALGVVFFITTTVIQLFGEFDSQKRNLRDVAAGLSYIFNIHPGHAVARAVLLIVLERSKEAAVADLPGFSHMGTFEWRLAGCPLMWMVIMTLSMWVMLFWLEKRGSRSSSKSKPQHQVNPSDHQQQEAPDIQAERLRVEHGRGVAAGGVARGGDVEAGLLTGGPDMVQVDDVSKKFPKVHAVNRVSFAVQPGEALALLGHNGAGKSTLMNIMVGMLPPTSGTVRVAHHDVQSDRTAALHSTGFSPQTNPLIEQMTCKEHLELYASLHGFPDSEIAERVSTMIQRTDLQDHAGKLSTQLSGGNKRKLALACAMISEPSVLISDEITAGVDPAASRKLLSLLRDFLPGRSVVLSTHLLHEAESLCQRMVIMVDGVVKCIGTRNQLTERFAEGYVLEVSAPQERHQEIMAFIAGPSGIPGCRVEDVHGKLIRFQAQRNAKLPDMFAFMEGNKETFGISEYALTQPNLESVFLNLCRQSVRAKELEGSVNTDKK
jgi:ATP-binding cassette subfamily A (ABC1) protein 3